MPPMSEDMEDFKPTIFNPGFGGGANWYGVSVDPETGWMYIPSFQLPISMSLKKPDPARSNFNYVGSLGFVRGPEGLPLLKGPYSKVTAIDLNTCEHVWETPIGDGPIEHPALKDLDLAPLGSMMPGRPVLTKSLLFIFTEAGGGMFGGSAPADGVNVRALDKKTGEVVSELALGIDSLGVPMTYAVDGKQYLAIAGLSDGVSEVVALSLP